MANPDHLKTLRQGVDVWNVWRKQKPYTISDLSPDLRGAKLSGRKLSRADLFGADLSEANLRRANLREADLGATNLNGANLSAADLRGANLEMARLNMASLSGANLTGARLGWASLKKAYLSETNLSEAFLIGADLNGANLSGADLFGADLSEANLCGANLNGAKLNWACLNSAKLNWAYLNGANLSKTSLREAHLSGARLSNANLSEASLHCADLRAANLSGADLSYASLVEVNITNADLTGCRVYGVSAWNVKLSGGTKQQDLVITDNNEPEVTVDNIEVAQFIYLLLHNQKIRSVIDTITSKVVLILGRFTHERKAVLDVLRDELRRRDYLPILFDFDKPASRTTDETITLLARMARFVIADISDAKSILQELRAMASELPSVPVQPIIVASQDEPGMFDFYRGFRSFLPVHRYATPAQLITELSDRVIRPSEAKALEFRATTAPP